MLHNETNRIAIHKLDPVSLLVDCPSSTSLTWPAGVAPNSCPTVLGHVVVGCLQVGASIGVTRPQGQCGLEVVNGCLVLFPVGQGCAARHQGISIMGPQMQGLVIAVQGICIGAYKQAETGDALARQPDSWVYGKEVAQGPTGGCASPERHRRLGCFCGHMLASGNHACSFTNVCRETHRQPGSPTCCTAVQSRVLDHQLVQLQEGRTGEVKPLRSMLAYLIWQLPHRASGPLLTRKCRWRCAPPPLLQLLGWA